MKKALLLALVSLTVSFSAWAQVSVLYFADSFTGTDQMAPALSDLGYSVTYVATESNFQTQLSSGSFDLVIYSAQNNGANAISATNLASYLSGGGRVMYWDYAANSTLSAPFGATFNGNTNDTTVLAVGPLAASLPTNPVTLVNGGWGVFSTGLTPAGGSTTLANFGNGDPAVVMNAAGTAIVFGFATDLTATNDLYKQMILLLVGGLSSAPTDFAVCAGESTTVTYNDPDSTYNPGNVFYVELSDGSGSFAAPDTIGMLATTDTAGVIPVLVPSGTPSGTGYRIRVVSSDPAIVGIPSALTVAPDPVAGFSVPTPLCVDEEFTVTSTATVASGSIAAHNYDFGEGSTSLLADPQMTYTAAGGYTITQIVTSDEGCMDTTSQAVTANIAPNSAFTFTNECAGETVSFNSTMAGQTSYAWDFGDGNTSSTEDPDHVYAQAGTYTVELTVVNAAGCATTTTNTIQIYEIPVAGFDPVSACVGDTAFFNNTSSIATGTLTYAWDFGDGNTSTDANPFNIYAATGNYSVTLIATSTNGCADTITKQVAAFMESVSISGTDTTCINSNENYAASATGAVNYSWFAFGGTITSGTNATDVDVTWTRAGLDSVMLVTTSQLTGCTDTTVYEVFISDVAPVAAIGLLNFEACVGQTFQLQDQSTIASGSIVSWFWDFGDNSTSTAQNPNKIYPIAGNYNITLIVTSNLGCADTVTQPVTIVEVPVAAFTANNACLNDTVFFTNTSVMDPLPTALYDWDFGDGNTSTATNPSHVYAAPGTYTVTLTASYQGPLGAACSDVTTRSVTVYAAPTADFGHTSACPTDSVRFNNLSSIPSGTLTYAWDFGDGATSALVNPGHAYATEGTYPVTLIATSNNGCADTIVKPVTVFAAPVADFANDTVCFGTATSFTNASNIATGTLSYFWDFDDAGATSTDINPTHTFSADGNYNVTLIATSNNGCADTVTITVPVLAEPTADFTVSSDSVCLGDAIDFTDNSTAGVTYAWSFGDGNTSALASPTHTYTAPGTYTATLVVTLTGGCTDTMSMSIRVFDEPNADFTATTVCLGDITMFTNNSTIGTGTLSYNWNFDDGSFSTDINPIHTYANPGTYNVFLTVTSNNGCVDTITVPVTVNPEPIADFTVSADSVCLGDTIFFFNASAVTGTDIVYTWSFGDGATSNAVDTAHLYLTPGTYNVWLAATDTVTGCTDTVMTSVRVFDEPVADFAATTVCLGTATQFTNNSTIGLGTLSYLWDFNDGSFSTDINPTHTYAAAGTYNVLLTATSNNGCVDTITVPVTVNPEPIADFTVSADSVCLGDTIFFFNASTVTGTDIEYTWNFGDGATSNAVDTAHLYLTPGTYNVWLAATDTVTGCTDTVVSSVRVFDEPVADFTATTVCLGTATQFTNNSTIGLGTLSYVWDFNDGSFSTDINPTHTYAAPGTYNVLLTATSNNGCVDTITVPVTVNPEPIADFTVSADSVCLGDTIFFFNASTVTGTDIEYTWSFGDGATSNAVDTAHLYLTPGTYNVWLATTDTVTGCTDTVVSSVRVFDEPVADFSATTVCFGTATQFTNNSTIGLGTLSYVWDFNDGSFSTDINPTHTYAAAGTYNVLLTATSNNGCVDTITIPVIVNEEPVSSFRITDADVCDGDTVFFVDASSSVGSDIVYTWDFGDGNTSDMPASVAHLYGGPGTYNVFLALTDTVTGCTDTSFGTVIVYHEPVAGWTAPDVCIGEPVTFTNGTTLGLGTLNFVWDFGDGTTSTDVNPTHTYTTDGIKTITLAVSTNNGCTDTFTNTIIVYPEPVAEFSAGAACFGFPVEFTNLTTIPFGSNSFLWEFGDGTTSTDSNATHTYAAMGVYTVTLTATSNAGCTNSVTHTVQINPNPSANFTVTTVCEGDATVFTNTSSVPTGSFTSVWDFGDGNTSQDTDPSYVYAAGGTYTATLIVTSDQGCTDTISKTVTVTPGPDAGFVADPVCYGETTQFTSTSTTPTGGGTIADVKWLFGDGAVSFEESPGYVYAAPGTYNASLIVVSSNGCRDTVTQAVVVHELPDSTIRPFSSTEFCDGDSVLLSAPAGIGYTYLWSDSSTTQDITVFESGTYCVTVTTQFGCAGSTCIDVIKHELPTAYAGEDTAISKGYTAQLHGSGAGTFGGYSWTPIETLDDNYSQTPIASPLETTEYVLLVTDSNQCQDTDTVIVSVFSDYLVEATNLITPNNDGKNDFWYIINIQTYPDAEVLIFDRWGTQVYQKDTYDNSWDGTTTDGKELGEGTYYYVIRFAGSDRTYKGAVNILR